MDADIKQDKPILPEHIQRMKAKMDRLAAIVAGKLNPDGSKKE